MGITRERFRELWKKYCEYYFVLHKGNKLVDVCSPRLAEYLIDTANGVNTKSLAEKYHVD